MTGAAFCGAADTAPQLLDVGADWNPDPEGRGVGRAERESEPAAGGRCANDMEELNMEELDVDEAELRPPPPNFAAIRALASSRSLVCLITYCSSVSPVSRSMPLRSSPGAPGASWIATDGERPPQ